MAATGYIPSVTPPPRAGDKERRFHMDNQMWSELFKVVGYALLLIAAIWQLAR
jgi:hypothetical protein